MEVTERLVFAPSVEGLVRGVGSELNREARDELRTLGFDLDRPLLPGYPAEAWHRALRVVARRVYPSLTFEEASRRMGERTVYGMGDTMLGKALLSVARLVGPRRTLLKLPNTVMSGSNFARLEAVELGPNHFQLTSRPYMGRPEYMQGAVHAAIVITGGQDVQVTVESFDTLTEKLVLVARWK